MSKKRSRKKTSFEYPDILIGLILVIIGIALKQNPDIYPTTSKYVNYLIGAGAFFSLVRISITIFVKSRRKHKLLSASIYKIAEMDGVTFENCCIEHFKKLGYSATPTATSGDYGADIILKKNGKKTVVQCKRYKGNVGVAAVQEVIGAKGYYKANKAMVITNSYYTPSAKTLAKANNVELWDRDDMIKIFKIERSSSR